VYNCICIYAACVRHRGQKKKKVRGGRLPPLQGQADDDAQAPSSLILDVSMYADIVRALDRTAIPYRRYILLHSCAIGFNSIVMVQVVTVVLASGVGAGFGATDDVLEYVEHGSRWAEEATQDLVKYYHKGLIAIVFLLIGMVLSVCATVVSTRLRVRAASNDDIADDV
jgi:hypothetical protein